MLSLLRSGEQKVRLQSKDLRYKTAHQSTNVASSQRLRKIVNRIRLYLNLKAKARKKKFHFWNETLDKCMIRKPHFANQRWKKYLWKQSKTREKLTPT